MKAPKAIYGYTRVSSSDQSTDSQVPKLKAAGCQVVRTEKLSGKSGEGRDQLATVLEFIGPGDVLACVKLDRLGRSTRDVLNLVHVHDEKGAFLRILEPTISTDGPMGKMVLTVLPAVRLPAGLTGQNFILRLPKRQSSICRAHQRNMWHWSIESMNVPIHLLLQRCGPDPTQAEKR